LTAEPLCHLRDQIGIGYGGSVDCHLVGTGTQQLGHVVDSADAAPHSYWHEHILRSSPHHFCQFRSSVEAGHDIDVEKFIHPRLIIAAGEVTGVTHDAETFHLHTLDQVWSLDV
jgi:hypothetical protein